MQFVSPLKKYVVLKLKKHASFCFWILLAIVNLLAIAATLPGGKLYLKVDKSSRLYLEGSSNVNTFKCTCTEEFPDYSIHFDAGTDSRNFYLKQAVIQIPVKKMDCQNRAINKDLYKALRADEFPFITVDIRQAYQLEECFLSESCDQWTSLNVDASISIANECRAVDLEVQGKKTGEGRYHFLAAHSLSMCDFNIDPPVALMGLVKVDPLITIHFDLIVEAAPVLK